MKIRLLYIIFIAITISCGERNNSISLSTIVPLLSGEVLGDTMKNRELEIKEDNLSTTIYFLEQNNKIEEIDLFISSKFDSSYLKILEYYNSKFNTTYQDTIFNTWETDSTEFILYKNSDSSILVNIFKRQ
ncbi:MAG: hypothetical protein ACPGVD_05800 [Flavobacteriales bacterium]